MNTVTHIKQKDVVQVMSGKEKGKTGKVLRILKKTGRVTIEKVNVVKRHTRPTGKAAGGIVEKEAGVHASNVLLFCDKCNKGVRTVTKVQEKGNKARICRKCGSKLDK